MDNEAMSGGQYAEAKGKADGKEHRESGKGRMHEQGKIAEGNGQWGKDQWAHGNCVKVKRNMQ